MFFPEKGAKIEIDSDDESPRRTPKITKYVSFASYESEASMTSQVSFKSARIRLNTNRFCRWYAGCTCFLYLVLLLAAWLVVPTLMAPHFIRGIAIDIHGATLRMTADGPRLFNPTANVFMNKSFMGIVPLITYQAQVHPFKADLYMRLEDNTRKSLRLSDTGGHRGRRLLRLGEIHINKPISLDSQHDFNETVGADVEITASADEMAVAAHHFVLRKNVTASTRAYVQISCLIGGILPLYLPIAYIEYDMLFPAFNKFQDKPVDLGELSKVHGEPGVLHVTAGARIYNPTPISIELEDPLNLRLDYSLNGTDLTIGLLKLPTTKVVPGFNNLWAELSVIQDGDNVQAIADLLSAYVSSDGDSGATPSIQVWLRHAGLYTSSSDVIRRTLALIELPIMIRPSQKHFLEGVTSDITFGGSLISMSPEPYHVTVNLEITSPIPQWVKVTKMHMIAYKDDLNGYEMYNVARDLDPSKYEIPPNASHYYRSLPLHFSEVHLHMGRDELYYACQSSVSRQLQVGVRATFEVLILPGGFKQEIHYVQNQVRALMCYHVAPPPWQCGQHTYVAWAEVPGNRSGGTSRENIAPVLL